MADIAVLAGPGVWSESSDCVRLLFRDRRDNSKATFCNAKRHLAYCILYFVIASGFIAMERSGLQHAIRSGGLVATGYADDLQRNRSGDFIHDFHADNKSQEIIRPELPRGVDLTTFIPPVA